MVPVILVSIDGKPLGDLFAGRTMSCHITKNDGGRADELSLSISNYDGMLAKPKRGAIVDVQLGFQETGQSTAGTFEVLETTKLGMRAVFEITGHSADLNKSWKKQKTRSWLSPKKLGDVLQEIAGDNGCQAAISAELAQVPIDKVLAQHGESDIHLWTRLARHYGAVGKIASGRAIFIKSGSGQTAGGSAMPAFVVTPNDLEDGWRIVDKDRPRRGKVKAHYHDRTKGKRVEVSSSGGGDDDAPDYTFPQTFGSNTEAQKAVDARKREFARGEKSFSGTLKSGSTQVDPGGVMTSQGFGDDDDQDWTVKRVEHDASTEGHGGGYVTTFETETKKGQ